MYRSIVLPAARGGVMLRYGDGLAVELMLVELDLEMEMRGET